MKKFFKPALLIVVLAAFFFFFVYFIKNLFCLPCLPCLPPWGQGKVAVGRKGFSLPVRLIIPAIDVNAKIQSLGVTPNGEMEVPDNIVDVGWFKLGSRPGENGSAVIAGHFNGENGKTGVFANLNKLEIGDKLYLKDDTEAALTFVVRDKRFYDSGYADDVFSQNDGVHLNLITCDGVWNEAKKSYSQRLVVFADISK